LTGGYAAIFGRAELHSHRLDARNKVRDGANDCLFDHQEGPSGLQASIVHIQLKSNQVVQPACLLGPLKQDDLKLDGGMYRTRHYAPARPHDLGADAPNDDNTT